MANEIQGRLTAAGVRVGIVVARFNELITSQLLKGAEDALLRHGGDPDAVDVAWVPGSFEIPVVAQQMARSGKYDAIVCLGALIRGATSHYDHLAASVTGALLGISVESGLPVVNGVLTTETIEQALERAGTKAGNKGYDAAVTALEMASVLRQLGSAR
ncbi:MAG: 6,7-dimethyl-8-ribityllumazine synthase [Armatimonadota bacterium]